MSTFWAVVRRLEASGKSKSLAAGGGFSTASEPNAGNADPADLTLPDANIAAADMPPALPTESGEAAATGGVLAFGGAAASGSLIFSDYASTAVLPASPPLDAAAGIGAAGPMFFAADNLFDPTFSQIGGDVPTPPSGGAAVPAGSSRRTPSAISSARSPTIQAARPTMPYKPDIRLPASLPPPAPTFPMLRILRPPLHRTRRIFPAAFRRRPRSHPPNRGCRAMSLRRSRPSRKQMPSIFLPLLR